MEQNLFIDSALTFEKVASETALPEDPNVWPNEILQELYKQVPYIADFDPHVVMDRVDAERGYAFGHVEVVNKSEIQRGADPQAMAAAGIKQCRIPIIVKNRKMQPFDILVTEDSKMLPLTEARLRQAVFRPQAFDVTSQTPGDTSMIGQLYPPFRQNYGFGGGGATMGAGGMGKQGAEQHPHHDKLHTIAMDQAATMHMLGGGDQAEEAYHNTYERLRGVPLAQLEKELKRVEGNKKWRSSNPGPMTVGTKKTGSILAAILPTIHPKDYSALFDKLADARLQAAYVANAAGTAPSLSILSGYQPMDDVKLAAAAFRDIPADVVQVTHLEDGYLVKRASHRFWAPVEETWDRGQVVRAFGEKLALAADMHGSATMAEDAGVEADMPEADTPELIKEFGIYAVQDSDGQPLVGHVFPNLIGVDAQSLPIFLFTNGHQAAVQGEIFGTPVAEEAPLAEGHPKGHGVFYEVLPDGSARCTVPLTIHAQLSDQGEESLAAESFDGHQVQVMIQPNIQQVLAGEGGHLLIPESMHWMPLDEAETVVLASTPTASQKTATARIFTVELRAGGSDSFSLEGMPVEKIARDQRQLLGFDEALFILAGLGVEPSYAVTKLAQAFGAHGPIGLRVGRALTLAAEQVSGAEKRASAFDQLARELRVDLVKEAAIIPDPVAVDTVLSLGFINHENLATFVSYLPKIDEAQSKMCELLISARLGLRDLPVSALEKSIRATEEVLDGLHIIAFGNN